jgi:hypothetical protein
MVQMRTFPALYCDTCKQVPKDGACACEGKSWFRNGVPASVEEKARLSDKGFTECRDINGDVYYCGPGPRIVWIYPDNTWFTYDGDATPGLSLEAYLEGSIE